jgi:hypothetical protein
MPIIAWTHRIVVTGNPAIAIPRSGIGGSRIAVNRNRRRWSIIITTSKSDSKKYSRSRKNATAGHQEKGKNFGFHRNTSPG